MFFVFALQLTIARLPLLAYFMFLQPELSAQQPTYAEDKNKKLNSELPARTEVQ
jgi:hypothetical protein